MIKDKSDKWQRRQSTEKKEKIFLPFLVCAIDIFMSAK